MTFLEATAEQYAALNGWNSSGYEIRFTQTDDGRYLLYSDILSDPHFQAVLSDLAQLTEVEYTPPAVPLE